MAGGLGSFLLFATRSAGVVAPAPSRRRVVNAGGKAVPLVLPEPVETRRTYTGPIAPGAKSTRGVARPLGPAGLGGGLVLLYARPRIVTPPRRTSWERPPSEVSLGTLSVTLGALSSLGAGTVDVQGPEAATLGALTGADTGTVAIAGTEASTLGALVSSAAGTDAVAGAATVTLGALTGADAGAVNIAGAAGDALDAVTLTADGTVGAAPPVPMPAPPAAQRDADPLGLARPWDQARQRSAALALIRVARARQAVRAARKR